MTQWQRVDLDQLDAALRRGSRGSRTAPTTAPTTGNERRQSATGRTPTPGPAASAAADDSPTIPRTSPDAERHGRQTTSSPETRRPPLLRPRPHATRSTGSTSPTCAAGTTSSPSATDPDRCPVCREWVEQGWHRAHRDGTIWTVVESWHTGCGDQRGPIYAEDPKSGWLDRWRCPPPANERITFVVVEASWHANHRIRDIYSIHETGAIG